MFSMFFQIRFGDVKGGRPAEGRKVPARKTAEGEGGTGNTEVHNGAGA